MVWLMGYPVTTRGVQFTLSWGRRRYTFLETGLANSAGPRARHPQRSSPSGKRASGLEVGPTLPRTLVLQRRCSWYVAGVRRARPRPPRLHADTRSPAFARTPPRGTLPPPTWTLEQAPGRTAGPAAPPYLPLHSPRPGPRASRPAPATGSARRVPAVQPPPSPPSSGTSEAGLPAALPESVLR